LNALIHTLNQRQHTRVVLGKEVTVEGSLSKALKLPELLKQIESIQVIKRDKARQRFFEIWPTFSSETRQQTLDYCGWYDVNNLAWDDPRSNKLSTIIKKE
jgi:hypothetical protein